MPRFRKVRFVDAGGDGPYVGYTDGTTWNGWANIWAPESTVRKLEHSQSIAPTASVAERDELIAEIRSRPWTWISVGGYRHRVRDYSNGFAFNVVESGSERNREGTPSVIRE